MSILTLDLNVNNICIQLWILPHWLCQSVSVSVNVRGLMVRCLTLSICNYACICICICIYVFVFLNVSVHLLMVRCPTIYHRCLSHGRYVKNSEQLFSCFLYCISSPCTNLKKTLFTRLHTLCKYWDNEAIIVGFCSPFHARITPSQMSKIMQQDIFHTQKKLLRNNAMNIS